MVTKPGTALEQTIKAMCDKIKNGWKPNLRTKAGNEFRAAFMAVDKRKHCYLYSVLSVGSGATYKCDIKEKNRTIRTGRDSKYVFCKEYKEK